MTDNPAVSTGAFRPRGDGLYDISTAADALGVHPQTLRFYERKGLIEPARSPGGQRRYSDDHLAQLASIQHLTGEGFNLAAVQRILELEAEIQALRQQLAAGGHAPAGRRPSRAGRRSRSQGFSPIDGKDERRH